MRRLSALALAVLIAGLLVWRWRGLPQRDVDAPEARGSAAASEAQPGPAAVATPKVDPPAPPPSSEPDGDSVKKKSAFPAALAWLLRSQNADGSWGGEPEMFEGVMYTKHGATSLALLALLGAGYTHLSREECDGKPVGAAIKEALKWMMANKPEGPLDSALAALMWGEQYGMTGSAIFKDHVDATFKGLLAFQSEDGSWGGDAGTSAWAAMALKSGEISGFEVPKEAWSNATAWFAGRLAADAQAQDAVAWVLLSKDRDNADVEKAKALIGARPPNWSQQDFGYWYHGSMALFQLDGPEGPLFKQWGEGLKATLGAYQEDGGAWSGAGRGTADVVKNSMGQLTMEVWYRYQSVFGAGKK
ncbi:MAG: hypothetical protein FD180_1134 [Planctomycetota bacterium]|nr:MAG: hypothetical protein FD180_1134 [Planctomycetota bacterium]